MATRFWLSMIAAVVLVCCLELGVSIALTPAEVNATCTDVYNGVHVAPYDYGNGFYLNLAHVFCGELRTGRGGRPRAVGYHYRGNGTAADTAVFDQVITNCTSLGGTYDYYVGNATISNSTDHDNKPLSTFFPDNWTPQQVVDAIGNAIANPNNLGWKDHWEIPIQMYPARGNATLIDTAYPICR